MTAGWKYSGRMGEYYWDAIRQRRHEVVTEIFSPPRPGCNLPLLSCYLGYLPLWKAFV